MSFCDNFGTTRRRLSNTDVSFPLSLVGPDWGCFTTISLPCASLSSAEILLDQLSHAEETSLALAKGSYWQWAPLVLVTCDYTRMSTGIT